MRPWQEAIVFGMGALLASAGCGRTEGTGSSARCGNERLGPGEECDDGNEADGDGCSGDCRVEP